MNYVNVTPAGIPGFVWVDEYGGMFTLTRSENLVPSDNDKARVQSRKWFAYVIIKNADKGPALWTAVNRVSSSETTESDATVSSFEEAKLIAELFAELGISTEG